MSNVLTLKGIKKSYSQGSKTLEILRGIDLSIDKGESIALIGASGAGKSTLLHIAGLLDQPTEGAISLSGKSMQGLNDSDLSKARGEQLGFVYQFHHLLPDFTALENVEFSLRIQGDSIKNAREKSASYLERMGLKDRMGHRPSEMSGGEQQRVAIARALVTNPSLLLADEPTGNLDEATSERVFELLLTLIKEDGLAAIIATHDKSIAARLDKSFQLVEGNLLAR